MEGATMTATLAGLTTVFTTVLGWVEEMVTAIATQPLLLLGVGIFAIGAVVGLANRLIRG